MKLNRAATGYVLAGIVMLLGFLILRFPGEALTDYTKAVLSARYPQLLFTLEAIRPSFPPGLACSDITVGLRERPHAIVRADGLRVRPGGLPLLRGRYSILATAEAYGGEMDGRIDFSQLFSLRGPLTAEVSVRDLRIDKVPWLSEVLARQIAGTLKGSVAFSGTTEAIKNGTGTIDFVLANGTFLLQENFLGFDKVDFTRIEGKGSFRNGAFKVTLLTLSGDQLRVSLKGNIILADEVRDSQIDLNGTLEIPVQNNKRVTLNIGGTLGNPKTRFM